ncbi:G-rich sequence factor 1 [Pygocentrus nattereri]|uniref:RRM domain-containing protein n=1 Tax=Pygocentrus nattereri TaxID=42514 RepID=A0A3B4CD24_PYGNA|nr:G-rich sequence factor 1 [Pygocentrus nattereri]
MAAYGRTAPVWSVLRCWGRRRTPCFKDALPQQSNTGRAVCLGSSSVKFTAWRETHSWSADPALRFQASFTWTSHRRALSSEAPYKEDEYPPLPEYTPTPTQETDLKEVFIIRVKGLPWSCSAEDLVKFFSECQIRGGVNGIHLMHKNGKPNGEAFIELEHEKDISKALEMHRQYLGPRYIEVYEVTNSDAEAIIRGTDESPGTDGVVRLRGLPFNCTEKDIIQFFSGLDIVINGVTLVLDNRGRSSGDAFVQFATQEIADQALQRDREVIGNRYIEVFPSKKSDIRTQYGRGRREASGTTFRTQRMNSISLPIHYIHMRGLPYQATVGDVINFFSPLRVAKVLIEYGADGRPSGEAEAYFTSHQDAVAAMSKDKECIQDRYIELFLNSASNGERH